MGSANYFRRGIEPDSGIRGKRMNITEHEMRGLITGKAMPADIFVGESLAAYLVRKFAVLQKERDAFAVLAEERRQFIVNGVEMGDILLPAIDGDPAIGIHERCLLKPKFAYDACLNSVRAEGVEMFSDSAYCSRDQHEYVMQFAAQLRAGEPS